MQFIMDTKPDGAPLLFNTLLFDVLYQLYHNFSFGFTADSTSRQNQNLEKLKPVLDYINCNYNRAISLTEMRMPFWYSKNVVPIHFLKNRQKYLGSNMAILEISVREMALL